MERATDAVVLADEFGRVAKVLVRRLDDEAGGHGLTSARGRVLRELAAGGASTVGRIAAAVGVAQGTASALVEGLLRDGLVERGPAARDRRVSEVRLTPRGTEVAGAWDAAYRAAVADLFAPLDAADRRALLRLLGLLAPGGRPGA